MKIKKTKSRVPATSLPRHGASFRTVCRLALKLPGVEVGTSWGTPGLKVRGRFLARLKEDGESLVLRIGFARREELLAKEPAVFYVTDHYLQYRAVLIRLPKIREAALGRLLREAWSEVAPKSLVLGMRPRKVRLVPQKRQAR